VAGVNRINLYLRQFKKKYAKQDEINVNIDLHVPTERNLNRVWRKDKRKAVSSLFGEYCACSETGKCPMYGYTSGGSRVTAR
jgi:hypothetical protein